MKKCKGKCGKKKPLSEFYDHPNGIDGKANVCIVCKIEKQKEYNRKKQISPTTQPFSWLY